jgi:hypothetical protein
VAGFELITSGRFWVTAKDPGAQVSLIRRCGGGFGSSIRLEIGSSVTAFEN